MNLLEKYKSYFYFADNENAQDCLIVWFLSNYNDDTIGKGSKKLLSKLIKDEIGNADINEFVIKQQYSLQSECEKTEKYLLDIVINFRVKNNEYWVVIEDKKNAPANNKFDKYRESFIKNRKGIINFFCIKLFGCFTLEEKKNIKRKGFDILDNVFFEYIYETKHPIIDEYVQADKWYYGNTKYSLSKKRYLGNFYNINYCIRNNHNHDCNIEYDNDKTIFFKYESYSVAFKIDTFDNGKYRVCVYDNNNIIRNNSMFEKVKNKPYYRNKSCYRIIDSWDSLKEIIDYYLEIIKITMYGNDDTINA